SVRISLAVRPPYRSGTISILSGRLKLFYDVDNETARCAEFDLANATPGDLRELAQAFRPETFGRNQEDVHDETYRRALKLGTEAFSTPFSTERAGPVEFIRRELLEGESDSRNIRLEMYKLNIYNSTPVFKSHNDTPRNENIFLSTSKAGLAFTFRDQSISWRCSPIHRIWSRPSHRLATPNYFSGIEHEVPTVKSSCHVTLMYDLYFAEAGPTIPVAASTPVLHVEPPSCFSR
ncbi:hypothetical protein BU15DRAFT_53419, partial [Melanogaster broomeanus]